MWVDNVKKVKLEDNVTESKMNQTFGNFRLIIQKYSPITAKNRKNSGFVYTIMFP